MTEETIVTTLWGRHRQWSLLADRLKSSIVRGRTATLAFSAAGAFFQTLSASLPGGSAGARVAAVIGTLALAAVPFIATRFLVVGQVRKWLRARSMSEALKSEIYRFRAHAAPYDGEDRVAELRESGRTLEIWVEALAVELANIAPDAKPAPGSLDAESYIKKRVNDQIDFYYRIQARRNAKRAALYRVLEMISAAAAALLGALVSALQWSSAQDDSSGVGAWVAVLTTIGGTVAAHAAANRYDQQARVFFATARQLEDLRDDWASKENTRDTAAWSDFVRACEETISAENRGWMAKLDPEEKEIT